MNKEPAASTENFQPATLSFFGPAPILEGEDEAAYNELLARLCGAIKPRDVCEEIWIHDVVDLTWEVLRYRRLNTELIRICRRDGFEMVLTPIVGFLISKSLADGWASGEESSVKRAEDHLATAGLSMDAVDARTLEAHLDKVERIERMIMAAEARRNAALREIERHRDGLGKRLRQITDQIEDAEYKEVGNAQEAA